VTDIAELTCKELVDLVTDYFEGAMPASERLRFEEHLMSCGGCRIYVEQMRLVVKTLGRLTEDEVPAEAKTQLLKAFRGWKGRG
jgi:anti-sigma factor RsiW